MALLSILARLATPVAALLLLAGAAAADPGSQSAPGAEADANANANANANAEEWVLLGKQSVASGVGSGVIEVGASQGRFQSIALEAIDNDIEIVDLKAYFERGGPNTLLVQKQIARGARSRPFPLSEGGRIDRIEVTYRSQSGASGRAGVAIYGLRAPAGRVIVPTVLGPPSADWVELGCSKPGYSPDTDVIEISDKRIFHAIKLRASGDTVSITGLQFTYARGMPIGGMDPLQIRDGAESAPIDMVRERLRRIELYSPHRIGGSAYVCALGQPFTGQPMTNP